MAPRNQQKTIIMNRFKLIRHHPKVKCYIIKLLEKSKENEYEQGVTVLVFYVMGREDQVHIH